MHHIRKHPKSGYYHYRQAVPKQLKPLYLKGEIVLSLRTKDPTQARLLAYQLSAKLLAEFEQAKQAMAWYDKPDSVKHLLNGQKSTSKLRQWTVNIEGIGSVSTDPNASFPDLEHEQALKALKQLTETNLPKQAEQPLQGNTALLSSVVGSEHKPLVSAFNEYVEDLEYRQVKSIKHIKPAVQSFVDWITEQHSNIACNQITPNQIKKYRKHLLNTYNKRTGKTGLTPATVYKRLGFIDTFFKWCQDQRYIADGDRNLPTYRLKGSKPDAVAKGTTYQPFNQTEIAKIFSIELWREVPHLGLACVVGAYTGGRLAEICYLNPHDITADTITFNTRTKNVSSKRTIPLHKKISWLNLYSNQLLDRYPEATTLFPWLTNPDKRIGDAFGKYLDKLNIEDSTKVFHSFRSNVSQQLKMTGCPQQYAEYYTGHLNRNLHNSIYAGVDEPVEAYRKYVNKIEYEGYTLSDLIIDCFRSNVMGYITEKLNR